MNKYFNRKAWESGRKVESEKRGSGNQFFSTKKDNENYFGSDEFIGKELKIVGLHTVPPQKEDKAKNVRAMKSFNVVLFDDGHQMSTTAFFGARGIKWPVGGNANKWDYLNAVIANGEELSVVPTELIATPLKTTDGKPAKWVDGVLTACPEKEQENRYTYKFEETEFHATDMSILEEEGK